MKTYDCFQFYNELDLLEIRLNELNDSVDYFVLVESELTHNLNEKPLYYNLNKERYNKFQHKIINLTVKSNEFTNNSMENDKIQRNKINEIIKDVNVDDFILISDLDEIPKKTSLENHIKNNPTTPAVFSQYIFYFYLNTFLYVNGSNINYGTTLFRKNDIINNIEKSRDGNLRDNSFYKINDGGWHFSFLGDKDFVINKIRNFAHSEFNYLTNEQIINFYENMKDPLNRGNNHTIGKIENNDILPEYVLKNIKKLEHLILK